MIPDYRALGQLPTPNTELPFMLPVEMKVQVVLEVPEVVEVVLEEVNPLVVVKEPERPVPVKLAQAKQVLAMTKTQKEDLMRIVGQLLLTMVPSSQTVQM